MSLYGSIRLAANSLRANQIALQVIGQNIANAQTPATSGRSFFYRRLLPKDTAGCSSD